MKSISDVIDEILYNKKFKYDTFSDIFYIDMKDTVGIFYYERNNPNTLYVSNKIIGGYFNHNNVILDEKAQTSILYRLSELATRNFTNIVLTNMEF